MSKSCIELPGACQGSVGAIQIGRPPLVFSIRIGTVDAIYTSDKGVCRQVFPGASPGSTPVTIDVDPIGAEPKRSRLIPQDPNLASLTRLLEGVAALPRILELLETQAREFTILREHIRTAPASLPKMEDGWLDAKHAAKYLDVSAGTFDKLRYTSSPRLKGYRVGGKTLYKRSDLDSFVMLYHVKSLGLA